MTFIAFILLAKDLLIRELFGSGEWHTCERCTHECNLPLHKSRENDENICDECSWEEYGRKHNVPWAAKRHSHLR